MGDDVGWFNVGAYHRGIMSGKTPNLDRLAAKECCSPTTTPRRAARRAGPTSSPARFRCAPADHRRPGRGRCRHAGPGRDDRHRPQVQGYATGQFGKNHLGDLNKFLPTVHGFDEFFGYLYHLDAMSDPYWYSTSRTTRLLRQIRPAQTSCIARRPTRTTRR